MSQNNYQSNSNLTNQPKIGFWTGQVISISISLVTLTILSLVYYAQIRGLNLIPNTQPILTNIQWQDVVVGLTIYLKTSIDFALLIGILMNKFPGLKSRSIIEVGTSLGNAFGTMVVLAIWVFFRQVPWLLGIMVILASMVLLKLAQTSLEHIGQDNHNTDVDDDAEPVKPIYIKIKNALETVIRPINNFLSPVVSRITPDLSFDAKKELTVKGLLLTSFTIPFILGLDDFAGYVPLFKLVNVFGFGLGVFLGHSILLILIFLNPKFTIKAIKNPIIAIIGSIAFVALAVWGTYEALHALNIAYGSNPSLWWELISQGKQLHTDH